MIEEKFPIERTVFISAGASEKIKFTSENPDSRITSDIINSISGIIPKENAEVALGVIIFITDNEYMELNNIIQIFKQWNFSYMYAISITNSIADSFYENENIGFVWYDELPESEFNFAVKNTFFHLQKAYNQIRKRDEYLARLLDMKQDQDNLINIGRNLAMEKNTDKLLRLILKLSKTITGADAGSIYIIEEPEEGKKQIRFKFSHTFSKELPLEEFVIPYDKSSIAGYVALTGKILNIPDVYQLSENDPISFNKSFDNKNNYRTKSMLVMPMRGHSGDIIGVIQLINSKKRIESRNSTGNEAYEIVLQTKSDFDAKVFNFDKRYEEMMEAVAGQAAISIENSRMFNQIQTQFEEFVKASVTAIESRDPGTSGHSFRVAVICKMLADAINKEHKTPFAEITFSSIQLKELEYAALLHDFGKVYIDLSIFMKAKKLFPLEYENLMLKLNLLYKSVEIKTVIDSKDCSIPDKLKRIKEIKDEISKLNEPTPLDKDPSEIVNAIFTEVSEIDCIDLDGNSLMILSPKERENLSIKRGSLNNEERKEIESHVLHTYNFVSKIPWPTEFKNIPKIAIMHHEKIDGTGYPYGIKGADIPIQARMMAVADIYDALTASDRPYKKAMTHERAMQILEMEANANKIDKELFDMFIKANINTENIQKEMSSMKS